MHLPENQHSMDILQLPEASIEAGQSALQKDLAHAVNLFDEGVPFSSRKSPLTQLIIFLIYKH